MQQRQNERKCIPRRFTGKWQGNLFEQKYSFGGETSTCNVRTQLKLNAYTRTIYKNVILLYCVQEANGCGREIVPNSVHLVDRYSKWNWNEFTTTTKKLSKCNNAVSLAGRRYSRFGLRNKMPNATCSCSNVQRAIEANEHTHIHET